MVVNLQDRRVKHTRRHFQEALIELLQENEYSSISIADLADQANLGRTTFYLHYRDKDTLLNDCQESILSKFTEKLNALPMAHWSLNNPQPLHMIFKFASENERFLKIMMHDPCGFIFFQRLRKIIVDFLTERMKNDRLNHYLPSANPLKLQITFYAGVILATIEWWVDNKMPYSISQMVQLVSKTLEKAQDNWPVCRIDCN